MTTTLLLMILFLRVLGQEIPAPLEISPSGFWDGNDGPWSTFTIGVGSPPQPLRVIPAAAQSVVTVVMAEECVGEKVGFQNCSDARGGVFRYNNSRTWHSNGVHDVEIAQDMGLGIKRTFLFGTDTVGLGIQPQVSRMSNQTVAGMKGLASSFTGAVGISPNPFNMTPDQAPVPTFFESLRSSTRIASRSWSYTAGAVNRNILGSLILGGYDAGRMHDDRKSPLSCKMLNDTLRELSVGLQTISLSEGPTASLSTQILKTPVSIPIEPLISRIWLPRAVCEAFEHSLGLNWNSTAQLYFITDEQHASFLARNISITFSVSDASLKGPATDIVFSYADLALFATYPLTDHPGRYFPIQRAYFDAEIVLGRAFLQAAYVVADYDRMTMNISQANLDTNSEKRIYTIMPPVAPPPSNSVVQPGVPNNHKTSNSSLAPGSIVGIVCGIVLGFAALVGIWYYLRRRNHQQSSNPTELDDDEIFDAPKAELEAKGFGGKWEMDGSHGISEVSPIALSRELEGDMVPVELEADEHARSELDAGTYGMNHLDAGIYGVSPMGRKLENEYRKVEEDEINKDARTEEHVVSPLTAGGYDAVGGGHIQEVREMIALDEIAHKGASRNEGSEQGTNRMTARNEEGAR